MRKIIVFVLFTLLVPATGFGQYHGYRQGYSGGHYGSRPYGSSGYGHGYGYNNRYGYSHGHHDNDWIVPLAIVGGVLGVLALTQMAPPPPPPPQRICRDTYNYTDEYGRHLYSRHVDRPCY